MLAFVVGVWLADQAPPQVARIAASDDGGTASYGVQRTSHSHKPLWRDDGCITLEYDSTTISVAAGQSIDDAFAAWSDATVGASCGRVTVTGVRTPNPPSTKDGRNTVHILHDRWCHPASIAEPEVCYDHSASAVTRVLFVDDPSDPDDGKILEIDMDLNAVDYELLAPGEVATTTKPALDLQAVATHEAGHALGLAHDCGTGLEEWPTDRDGVAVPSCADASPAVLASTMFYVVAPNDTSARTVEASDVTGACAVVAGLTCEVEVDGGCSTGGGGWLACVSVMLALSLRGRRTRYHLCVEVPQRIQRFEVLEHIGSGGMGTVVRARDPQLERDVAIKLLSNPTRDSVASLSPDDTLDLRGEAPHSADELLREARMMAKLSHPNVLPVYEVGLANDAVFLVMEHIAGTDLATWLADPRSTEDICAAFTQAGRGLAAAHAQNIIHRDFKPSNVLVGSDGRIRVADFGLSRLTLPEAMVRIDDGRGTPRYMAPELWRGVPASAPSDVFAFCISLGEALHERTIAPRLKALIVRGGADDPTQRPAMTELVAALENRGSRLPWIAAFGAAGAVGVIAAVLIFSGGTSPACGDADFTGQWDAALRARVQQHYQTQPPASVDRLFAGLDARRDAIAKRWHASCVDQGNRVQTVADGTAHRACLDRRRFELAALVERMLAAPLPLDDATDRMTRFADATTCDTELSLPLPKDPRPVAALYARYVASYELYASQSAHLSEVLAIEKAADALGERELAARAAYTLGSIERLADKLADADAALQRSYRGAQEQHLLALEADALIERSRLAGLRGDVPAAASLASLAKDLVDRPDAPILTRAHVYGALGRAAADRGELVLATEHLMHALELAKSAPEPRAFPEMEIRFDLTHAMVQLDDRPQAAIAMATESVERAKQLVGEHDANYGVALNLLAMSLNAANELDKSLEVRRRALAHMIETLPPEDSHIAIEHADLAADLQRSGHPNEAIAELELSLHGLEHNETAATQRTNIEAQYGIALFNAGHHEQGLERERQALEDRLSVSGEVAETVEMRTSLIELELELDGGNLTTIDHDLAAQERWYRAHPDDAKIGMLVMNGEYRASLALQRHDPLDAEKRARAAIEASPELHVRDDTRANFYELLGLSLIAQKKWAEARAAIDTAQSLSRKTHQQEDAFAVLDVDLAQIDLGEGHRAEARERVTHARAVLAKYLGVPRSAAAADALIAQLQKSR